MDEDHHIDGADRCKVTIPLPIQRLRRCAAGCLFHASRGHDLYHKISGCENLVRVLIHLRRRQKRTGGFRIGPLLFDTAFQVCGYRSAGKIGLFPIKGSESLIHHSSHAAQTAAIDRSR